MPMIQFQPILAKFRQVPPILTYIAPIQTFCSSFYIYMIWVDKGGLSFKISLLACILETPETILKIFVGEWYILCHIPSIDTDLLVLLPNLLEIFTNGQNLGFMRKSSVNFEFFIQIHIARLITDLQEQEKVLGNVVGIQIES